MVTAVGGDLGDACPSVTVYRRNFLCSISMYLFRLTPLLGRFIIFPASDGPNLT